jgi:hypothetical protein
MQIDRFFNGDQANTVSTVSLSASRKTAVGLILITALIAFEIFNFDTTRFALESLLGDINFMGMTWATILAVAFCAIDFAGLARMFTPERGKDEPKAVWYLMGAWFLGATMNAVMTWWAVSLTLLSHDFGNEVLSREQLLQFVPIFVAALVLLTRILFIGALSVAGEHVFERASVGQAKTQTARPQPQPVQQPSRRPSQSFPTTPGVRRILPEDNNLEEIQVPRTTGNNSNSRINRRPPTPTSNVYHTHTPTTMRAKDRR